MIISCHGKNSFLIPFFSFFFDPFSCYWFSFLPFLDIFFLHISTFSRVSSCFFFFWNPIHFTRAFLWYSFFVLKWDLINHNVDAPFCPSYFVFFYFLGLEPICVEFRVARPSGSKPAAQAKGLVTTSPAARHATGPGLLACWPSSYVEPLSRTWSAPQACFCFPSRVTRPFLAGAPRLACLSFLSCAMTSPSLMCLLCLP